MCVYWRGDRLPTPVFLPGESHGQRSLAGYSPQGCKELDTTEKLIHTHRCVYILINIYIYEFWETREWHCSQNAGTVLPYSPSLSLPWVTKSLRYRWAVNCSDDYKLPQRMTSRFEMFVQIWMCPWECFPHKKIIHQACHGSIKAENWSLL